jgi:hypothetical protein
MSEIFEEYIKIITAKDKSEEVYGLKPETLKDMDYKKNIMEIAHPKKVVIAPSYDPLNGLVENNIERQNIFLNIVNKPVSGQVNLYKNAKSSLVDTLVCIGTQQDLKNNDKLADLADACLRQLSEQQTKKTAAIPLIALSVVGIAALGGAIYWHYHAGAHSEAYKEACDHALKEIEDVLSSTAVTYKESFYKTLRAAQTQIEKSKAAFIEYDQIVDKMNDDLLQADLSSDDGKDAIIAAASLPFTKQLMDVVQTFKKELNTTQKYVYAINRQTASKAAQENLVQSRSWYQQLGKKVDDMTGNMFYGGLGLISNDLDDINQALANLIKSGNEIVAVYKDAKTFAAKTSEEAQKYHEQKEEKKAEEKTEPAGSDTAKATTDMEALLAD